MTDVSTRPLRSIRENDLDRPGVEATAKYGDNAPMAAVCCNACRTCVQTNLIGLALGAITAAGAIVTRGFAKPS
jgi:hypothetical protein